MCGVPFGFLPLRRTTARRIWSAFPAMGTQVPGHPALLAQRDLSRAKRRSVGFEILFV